MKDDSVKQAFQGWDLLSASQEEVFAYEARLKQVLDEEATRVEAELREKAATERAMKQGLEQGLIDSMLLFLSCRYPDSSIDHISSFLQTIRNVQSLKEIQSKLFVSSSFQEVQETLAEYQ